MKSITLGLALGLLGGVALGSAALAQTPPSPAPALKQPAAGPTPTPPASQPNPASPPAPQGQQNAQNGQPAVPTPSGPPEGMIVETPNGFYLVRPGDPNPQRLDLGRTGGGQMATGQGGQGRMGQGQPGMDRPMMGQNGPAMTEDDEAMGDMDEGGMQPPPPPHPHQPPPHPPEGKGARFRIKTPNLTLGVKCPDDEPIKACVDAISQLMDKVNTQPR